MAIPTHLHSGDPELGFGLQELLDALPDAAAVVDGSGKIQATNMVWTAFAVDNGGADERTGVGVNYLQVCRSAAEAGDEDARNVAAELETVLTGSAVERQYEYECSAEDHSRWYRTRISLICESMALVTHLNITREKRAELEYRARSEQDMLTGLANREGLRQRVHELREHPGSALIGVLYLDLDGFKQINDTQGHHAGDEMLQVVAARLRNNTKGHDVLARLGGDEFAVVCSVQSETDLAAIRDRLESALAEPVQLNGLSISHGVSIGWAILDDDTPLFEALSLADIDMLERKSRRKRSRGPDPASPVVVSARSAVHGSGRSVRLPGPGIVTLPHQERHHNV